MRHPKTPSTGIGQDSGGVIDSITGAARSFLEPRIEQETKRRLRPVASFLIAEGAASMVFSQDQRALAQIGRLARIFIGIQML